MNHGLCLFLLTALCMACGLESPPSSLQSDAIGRRLFGTPKSYEPLPLNAESSATWGQSTRTLRQLGWRVFQQIVQPEEFSANLASGQQVRGKLPKFMLWYSIEDIQRYYRYALQLTPDAELLATLPYSRLDMAREKLNEELESLPNALRERLQSWLKTHPNPSQEEWMGLGGVSRVYYSPDLVQALLHQHQSLLNCFQGRQRPSSFEEKPTCWPETLMETAAVVKAEWVNAKAPFYSYSTDATHLASLMSSGLGSWKDLAQLRPIPDEILAARLDNERLLLPGLHIMTRDKQDWLWITAFWSEDPNTDFGADRPPNVMALGPPFDRYKMCVVASFQDEAQDLDQLALTQPDLVAAYRAAQQGNRSASWCSNPYLEKGIQNHHSNCIGCHQFAGTAASSEFILNHPTDFPAFGSLKQRQTFPTDYLWSVAAGQNSLLNILSVLMDWRRSQTQKILLEVH